MKYRVYQFDHNEHVMEPPTVIDCPTDESAVKAAEVFLAGYVIEVSDEARRIARLVPDNPADLT